MALSSFYPVICTDRVAQTRDVRLDHLEVDDVDAEFAEHDRRGERA